MFDKRKVFMIMDEKILSQKFKYLFMTEMPERDFQVKDLYLDLDTGYEYMVQITFDYMMDVDPHIEEISHYLRKSSDSVTKFLQKYQYDSKSKTIVENGSLEVMEPLIFGLDFVWGEKFIINMAVNVGPLS